MRRLFRVRVLVAGSVVAALSACAAPQPVPQTVVVTQIVVQTATSAPTLPAASTMTQPAPVATGTPSIIGVPPVVTQTPLAPTATPTPPTIVILPIDGSVVLNVLQIGPGSTSDVVTDALVFQVEAFHSHVTPVAPVEPGSLDGGYIDHVDLRVLDEQQNVVYEHTELNAHYCLFGGGEPNCEVWRFADHNYQWPNGQPVVNGNYDLQATGVTLDQKTNTIDTFVQIQLPSPTDVVTRIVRPAPGDSSPVTTELVFQAEAYDPAVGTTDGAGIASVDMQIVDPNGFQVHQRTEVNARYCAFGGGEPDCVVWVFAEHNNQWPNGQPIQPGTYTLIASGITPDGRSTTASTTVDIEPAP